MAPTHERADIHESAHSTSGSLVLREVNGKSNKITSVPGLLDTLSLLEITGCIITVDALNTQREVARSIKAHNADYVMALKQNQGSLFEDVSWLFETEAQPLENLYQPHERN